MTIIPAGSALANALDANPNSTVVGPDGTTYGPAFSVPAGTYSNTQSFNTSNAGTPASTGQSIFAPASNQTAPSSMGSTDFRLRISPLNSSAFFGVSSASSSPSSSYNALGTTTNPFNAVGGISNTGVSSTMSAGQLPTTAPGAANLLSPLIATNGFMGVMFPYSPTISFEQSVEYSQTNMIQTNMTYEVYNRTPSVRLTIQGKFTVQNQVEGRYAMAAIHFFRVASKMYFGTLSGANAGLPPPILVLNGYGTYMFNKLNCILESHSFGYAENMDTVTVQLAGGTVRLPAMFDLSVTLMVQQTPQQMRSQFNLDSFRSGQLMTSGGWI